MTVNRIFESMNCYRGFIHVSGCLERLNVVVKNEFHAYEICESPKSYRIKLWSISGERVELLAEHKHENKVGLKKFKADLMEKYISRGGSIYTFNARNICFTYESKPWELTKSK